MKKIFYIITLSILTGCNPYQGESQITPMREIAPIGLTPEETLNAQIYDLKQRSLISENLFDSNDGLNNGASVLNNELILDNSANQNQFFDTQISVKDLDSFSLSVWFKTNDPNKIQMIFWQGQNGQNGWGAGSNNVSASEFHIGLNHWNNTLGESVSTFYGYNESALSPASLPVAFPIKLNPTSGAFDLVGQRFTIDSDYHHLVVTVSKTPTEVLVKTYLDGILLDQGVGGQVDNSAWNSNLLIGKPGVNNQRQFFGKLSKFMSFNKELSANEVSLIFNHQK